MTFSPGCATAVAHPHDARATSTAPRRGAPPEVEVLERHRNRGAPAISIVYGVDGCCGTDRSSSLAWLVVRFDENEEFGSVAVVESFTGVLHETTDAALVLIDIPIGLPDRDHPTRVCDVEARRLIGARRSSVFPAPARRTLLATGYSEANQENLRTIGKGLTRQGWGICPRIADVDAVLKARPDLRHRYRESHPEVCFAALNGWRPAVYAKRHPEGRGERLDILPEWLRPHALYPWPWQEAAVLEYVGGGGLRLFPGPMTKSPGWRSSSPTGGCFPRASATMGWEHRTPAIYPGTLQFGVLQMTTSA